MPQSHTKKRESRIRRELHRHGTEKQGNGWAAKRASRRLNRRGDKHGALRSKGYRLK